MTGLVDWLKLRERSREVPSKVSLHDCSAHVNNVYTKIPVAADADGQYQFADPCPQSMKTVSTVYQVILIRQKAVHIKISILFPIFQLLSILVQISVYQLTMK